jgi:hypothetical protein
MSVSPIGSAGVSPLQQSPSSQGNWQSVLNSAAGTLGLSTTALQQQLQSGQSLGSIAQGKGVSQQTLAQSISSALTQNGSTASGAQLQQIATNIANRTPGAGGHHHGGGGMSTQQSLESTLLAALDGTSSSSTTNPLATDPTQTSSGIQTPA